MAKRVRKSAKPKRMSYYGDIYVTQKVRKRVSLIADHEPTCEEVLDCLSGGGSVEFVDCTDEEELECLAVEKVDFNEPSEVEDE